MSQEDIQGKLLRWLRDHQVLTLSVVDAGGQPYAAALFYAVDDALNFYVVSDPKTRHGAAMLASGHVAGTIQRDRQQWADSTGVQFTGSCRRLGGIERARGWAVFIKRFGFLQTVKLAGIGDLAAALAKIDLWQIQPAWMRLIDNSVHFAHKEEWTRSA